MFTMALKNKNHRKKVNALDAEKFSKTSEIWLIPVKPL